MVSTQFQKEMVRKETILREIAPNLMTLAHIILIVNPWTGENLEHFSVTWRRYDQCFLYYLVIISLRKIYFIIMFQLKEQNIDKEKNTSIKSTQRRAVDYNTTIATQQQTQAQKSQKSVNQWTSYLLNTCFLRGWLDGWLLWELQSSHKSKPVHSFPSTAQQMVKCVVGVLMGPN